ncbi:DNA polymerase beta domain-containing protein region [Burkholderia pseudomallei]|nr:DNA polymerase beta domain-containing protein region [Burkholderia pseudomallei]CAJ4809732.1 DNA polymerase beta domain-containing protein region [Burkholderia pseudomallei]
MGMSVPNSLAGLGMVPPYSLAQLGMVPPPAPSVPQWIHVTSRFSQFLVNLQLTTAQDADGRRKKAGVVSCLNSAYYGSNSEFDNSFYIGSWGKGTAIRPPRDVDVYFVLPPAAYGRFGAYAYNPQSALLQEVKRVLQRSYPTTTNIRGDGPVVLVGFESYSVEVVPVFFVGDFRYWVCDTKNGGSYKQTAPWAEIVHIENADTRNANNLRPLIRMLKSWQACCSVPIKSFHLELLAVDYLDQSQWRFKSIFWYDWVVRDFFLYMISRANTFAIAPGTGEYMWLGETWKSKAESAYVRAAKASSYEAQNMMIAAGEEWQKIFGSDIPRTV